MAQLARMASTTSLSDGGSGWTFATGSDAAAMVGVNKTSPDTVTWVRTPVGPGTHKMRLKVGKNLGGVALVRAYDNASLMIRACGRADVGAVTLTLRLYEGSTLLETKVVGSIAAGSASNNWMWNVLPATVDAIVDFDNLHVELEANVSTSLRSFYFYYVSYRTSEADAPKSGLYQWSAVGQIAMPAAFEQFFGAVNGNPVIVGNDCVSGPDTAALCLLVYFGLDLHPNHYAKITMAATFDISKTWLAGFTRWNPVQTIFGGVGSDSWRYDMVTNAGTSTYDVKRDGVPGIVLDQRPFATTPAPVPGDTISTRSIGNRHSGTKNDVEITVGADNLGLRGYTGFVLNLQNGGAPWNGISAFETGTIEKPKLNGKIKRVGGALLSY